MMPEQDILTDSFGRNHTYLRISLTELCNLRCSYCMPAEGIELSPRNHIMNYEEIFDLAGIFVKHGVTRIRLTGGEPLVRRNVQELIKKLASLPVELSLTTNAVLADRFIDVFKDAGVSKINVSLDTLREDRFKQITRRDHFQKVWDNIQLLLREGFNLKLNTVLMKNFNEDEILDFVALTRNWPVSVRFIEFMPFDGNRWDLSKLVSLEDILHRIHSLYPVDQVEKLVDGPHDTSKNYRISGFSGGFAIISTVTNPFCDTCNRLRLTANGHLKNCLFSASEQDLLSALRRGDDVEPLIKRAVQAKQKARGGMDTLQKFSAPEWHTRNRSMISIGG